MKKPTPLGSRAQPGLSRYQRVIAALLVSNLLSAFLLVIRFSEAQNMRYWFLLWNLCLAWVPLAAVLLLRVRLKKTRWYTWQNCLLSVIWLGFLPNSFYLLSDFIHLHPSGEVSLLFDIVMLTSFAFNGFVVGFSSVLVMHKLLLDRFTREYVNAFIGVVLLLCSFAIYLGRDLRWNTWDILVNPAGIIFDVSERVINPLTHAEVFSTTALFFALLGTMYITIWQFIGFLRND